MSLYFTMYTFLTVGYGDVAVVNIADKVRGAMGGGKRAEGGA